MNRACWVATFSFLFVLLLAACAPLELVKGPSFAPSNPLTTDHSATTTPPSTREDVAAPTLSPTPIQVTPDEIPTASVEQDFFIIATLPLLQATPLPAPGRELQAIALALTPNRIEESVAVDLTPTVWPTVTKQVLAASVASGLLPCSARLVADDLLLVVTQQFSLPETYTPPDLVLINRHFDAGVTVGIESQVRANIIPPLQDLIGAMHAAGLEPSILSGYRSYGEQYLAWKWWNSQYPERVAIMSAKAGHSEHQLGTTVDFGSPALDHLFHVDFADTPEGVWLRDNAHRYGFTMSYPADSYEITGFKHEPWHYRYVGIDMSSLLYHSGQTLTEWQLENLPPPCIP